MPFKIFPPNRINDVPKGKRGKEIGRGGYYMTIFGKSQKKA